MATTAAQLMIEINVDSGKAEKGLKNVSDQTDAADKHTHGFLSTLEGYVGGAAIVSAAGTAFDFLKGQVVDSWQAGMDANAVIAQTNAGLKSTHDVSGMTAQSIADLSTHIMNMTGIDDDAVQTGANMLLTFTNLGKSVFPTATQAVADMATKMNGGMIPSSQQMQQNSILLGKALNDPLKGISALTRVGVTFDDQQKKQIATMMAHNDVAGAQGVILKEINKEFGGAAAAAGQANGGIAILTAQFNNMKESLGQQLIPIVGKLLTALQPLIQSLAGGLGNAISGIGPLVDTLTATFSKLPLGPVSKAFAAVATAAEKVGGQIQSAALPVLKQLGDFFTQHILPAVSRFAAFAASTLIPMFGQIATFVLSTVVPALLQFGAFVTDTLLPAVMSLVGFFKANVLPVLMTLVKVVLTDVLPVVESLAKTFLEKVLPPIQRIVGYILPVLIPAFQAIGWVVKNVVGPVLNFLMSVIGFLLGKLADLVGFIASGLGPAFAKIGQFTQQAGAFFTGLGTKVSQIFTGIRDSVLNGVKGILQALAHIPGPIGDMARGALKSIDALQKGTSGATGKMASDTDANANAMKASMLMHTAEMHEKAAANFDRQRQDIIKQMENTRDPVKRHALEMKLAMVTHSEDMEKKAAAHAQNMARKVAAHTQEMKVKSSQHSADMVSTIVTTIGGLPGKAITAVGDLATKLVKFFSDLATQATQWGTNLIQNLINGITNMAGKVKDAVGNIAKNIKDFLGFHSPAKEGPGADADTWAPNLMRMFATGLTDATPALAAAAKGAMAGVKGALSGAAGSLSLTTSGGVSANAAAGLLAPSAASLVAQQMAATAAGAGGHQAVILQLDGLTVGRAILPHLGEAARIMTGVRTM